MESVSWSWFFFHCFHHGFTLKNVILFKFWILTGSCLVAKSCPTLGDPLAKPARLLCPWHFLDKDTGEGCHFLLQGSSPPRDQTWVFCIVGGFFPNWTTSEAHSKWSVSHWVMADSFVTPWTVAHQTPLSMGFSRQEYWSGLPFPSPGNLSNPGIKPGSPALQADSLPLSHQGSTLVKFYF